MATKTKATTLADNIATYFPEPDGEIQLHHKNEAPDPISILRFRKHLKACALEIPLQNEPLGLLGDILDPMEYLNITGVTTALLHLHSQETPTNANNHHYIGNDKGNAETTSGSNNHESNTRRIHQWPSPPPTRDAQLQQKQRNLPYVPSQPHHITKPHLGTHWTKIHKNTGFKLVHPRTLIEYIAREFGQVTAEQLNDNNKKLDQPWDPSTPIQNLYNHINTCKDFAEAGNELKPDEILIRKAYPGCNNLSCDEWFDKPPATEKDWTQFQTFFNKAEIKVRNHTSKKFGLAQEESANTLLTMTEALLQQQQEIAQLKTTADMNTRAPLQPIDTNTINQGTDLQALKEQVYLLCATINQGTTAQLPPLGQNPLIQGYDSQGILSHTAGRTTSFVALTTTVKLAIFPRRDTTKMQPSMTRKAEMRKCSNLKNV